MWIDSTIYLSYAQSVQAGRGLSIYVSGSHDLFIQQPLTTYPPLYPLALGLLPNPLAWARILNIGTLIGTALLTFAISYSLLSSVSEARRSWYGAIASLLFLAIPAVNQNVFSYVNSETLFVPLTLGGLYLFSRPTKTLWASVLGALLLALALLTRYVGVVCIVTAGLYVLMQPNTNRWRKLALLVLSCVPVGFTMLNSYALTGNIGGARRSGELPNPLFLLELGRTFIIQVTTNLGALFRVVHLNSNWVGFGIAGLWVIFCVVRAWPHRRGVVRPTNIWIIFVPAYLLGLWGLTLFDNGVVASDPRHLAVVMPPLAALFMKTYRYLAVPVAINIVLAALFLTGGVASAAEAGNGLSFNSLAHRTNPILAQLPALVPPGALVHGIDAWYLSVRLEGRPENPVRGFGGMGMIEEGCRATIYLPGYSKAVYTLIESPFLRNKSVDELKTFFTKWAAPCGTVQTFAADSFAMLMVVDLERAR